MASKLSPVRLVTLLALLAAPAAAQQAARPLKIGVIDPERVVAESARGKLAVDRLNKERDQRLAEGTRMRQEIADLQKRMNDGRLSLGADKLKQLNDEIEEKTIGLQRYGENAQREMTKLEQEIMDPIEQQILKVINQIGAEQGYTLIFKKFQSGLIFAYAWVDLAPLVIPRLTAAAAPAAAATPKPPGH
jgi:Skp family chaperone for outer membrane proteins